MNKSILFSTFFIFLVGLFIFCSNVAQGDVSDCDWNSGDLHKMHWPQEPDLSSTGTDVSMKRVTLADDFECSSSGPITDVHIWGSFVYDNLPPNGPDSLTFKISIYSDIPAIGDLPSKPGDLLWTRTFRSGEYSTRKVHDGPEGWYDTYYGTYQANNHNQAYQYNFCISYDPFTQVEGTIYWLVIDELRPDNADYVFGWKTTTRNLSWNDNAVLLIDGTNNWSEMVFPDGHNYKGQQLDLAFVITGNQTQREYDWGDAPDGEATPGYPTLSFNNGAYHIITGPWLGDDTDQPDAELNGQPESNALGDDLDIEPLFSLGPPNDDEDGVSIPPMYQGQPADITLVVNGDGGYLDAWIDYNHDMTWGPSEQIHSSFLPDGPHNISFIVPGDALTGPTFARFRISKEGFLSPGGPASSGEVEDYKVIIYEGCSQCTEQEFIRGDANNDGQVDDADVTLIFDYLLAGGPTPKCMDAADADDNGIVDIDDATYILHYVNGGPVIPEPFPDCGTDPTSDNLTCEQYDDCPGCDSTNPRYTKWLQLPDVTENGIAIQVDNSDGVIRTIADDFECINENLLTDVHLWCSWVNDVRGVINKIHLSIHADDPVGSLGSDPDNQFSKPAPDALWEMDFLQDQFKESLYYTLPEPGEYWWDPPWVSIGADRQIWRIDIDIDPNFAFKQLGSIDNPRIYWLVVRAETEDGELGWKSRRWPDHFMDDAVMDEGSELPRIWKELRYPDGHPYDSIDSNSIDMAFCLTYTPETPDALTFMPVNHTQCPVAATKCPTVATRCPPVDTQCPVVLTRCPPLETQCPVALTQCNIEQTVCPIALTRCPLNETECPPAETRCPPVDTECPPIETQCPPVDTQCPPVESRCPPGPTGCQEETIFPVVATKCPIEQTKCPAILTECPAYETRCPLEETKCPFTSTKCQIVETQCPVVNTECPPVDTECPPIFTLCPSTRTLCSPVATLCPPVDTQCPAVSTECTMVPTECPPVETQCPLVFTQCTISVFTQCPTQITVCPDCGIIIKSLSDTIAGTGGLSLEETKAYLHNSQLGQCPTIETTCPTILSKDVLAKQM